jgi:hypothetical protein
MVAGVAGQAARKPCAHQCPHPPLAVAEAVRVPTLSDRTESIRRMTREMSRHRRMVASGSTVKLIFGHRLLVI